MITTYGAMEKRREKDVQNIIIPAVVCNQLSVLPSISTVGNLANDPLRKKTERKDSGRVKLFSRSDAPSELLLQSGGNCVQDLDPTEGQVFENP